MRLKELLEIANDAYPDGLIAEAAKAAPGGSGDSLAEFIFTELKETFDPKLSSSNQLADALSAMQNAMDELREVYIALCHRQVVEDEIYNIKMTPKEELPLLMENLIYPKETKGILLNRLRR